LRVDVISTASTVASIASQLAALARAQQQPFSVVFHGGEPLLIGADGFERTCRILRAMLPVDCSLHLQTNGILLSESILRVCFLYDVGISISIDGPIEIHDANRVDVRGRGSHDRVLEGIRRVVSHPHGANLFTGVLAVVDIKSDPIRVYEFLKSTGAPSIDFLYRDGNHEVLPLGKANHLSMEYGEWMGRLLDHYLDDRTPTPIRFLDDMIRILIGGVGRKEGVGTSEYGILVIETEGTIAKNDTLKSISKSADQFDLRRSVATCNLTDFVNSIEFLDYHQSQRPSSTICQKCPYLSVCGGGMPSHRFSKEKGLSNPTVFCADQQHLIERIKWHISRRNVAA
jgi:uncharacterized protein